MFLAYQRISIPLPHPHSRTFKRHLICPPACGPSGIPCRRFRRRRRPVTNTTKKNAARNIGAVDVRRCITSMRDLVEKCLGFVFKRKVASRLPGKKIPMNTCRLGALYVQVKVFTLFVLSLFISSTFSRDDRMNGRISIFHYSMQMWHRHFSRPSG